MHDLDASTMLRPVFITLVSGMLPLMGADFTLLSAKREILFKIVGGIDRVNCRCAAIRLSGLKLIVDTGEILDDKGNGNDKNLSILIKAITNTQIDIFKTELSKQKTSSGSEKYVYLKKIDNRLTFVGILLCINNFVSLAPPSTKATGESLEYYNLLPKLIIRDEYIYREDLNEKIILKGISLLYNKLQGPPHETLLALAQANIEANEKLGLVSNVVRLSYFSKDITEPALKDFEELACYLASKGMYLIITPHNGQIDDRGQYVPANLYPRFKRSNFFLPDEQDGAILAAIARRLRGFNHIIFGLWNEPSRTTWPAFAPVIRKLANGIFEGIPDGQPRPLLMVPGLNWSRDFRNACIPLPKDSYLIDVHEYPLHATDDIGDLYASMIHKVPILFSEMGGVLAYSYHPQSPEDLERIRRILSGRVDAPENLGAMHYCIWKGDDAPDGVRDPRGGLSLRGRLILEEKRQFPTQYDFIKGR